MSRFALSLGLAALAVGLVPHPSRAASPPGAAPSIRTEVGSEPRAAVPSVADPVSRNVAARARTLECGHQWNAMKRAGTASGTWKEFSRRCLAQK